MNFSKVQSKIIYNDSNPNWNQELKIGLKVHPNSFELELLHKSTSIIYLSFHQCATKLK
jgi:hypothetical protein